MIKRFFKSFVVIVVLLSFLSPPTAESGMLMNMLKKASTKIKEVGKKGRNANAHETEKQSQGSTKAPAVEKKPIEKAIKKISGWFGKKTIEFADKTAARKAFSGDIGIVVNRFFSKATGKSKNFKVTELHGKGKRLEFFSPAENAGYGKRYVQEIDSKGNIMKHYKETIGPKGLIETKWLQGRPAK